MLIEYPGKTETEIRRVNRKFLKKVGHGVMDACIFAGLPSLSAPIVTQSIIDYRRERDAPENTDGDITPVA